LVGGDSVRPDAEGVPVPGGDDRLVQPEGARLAAGEHAGREFLRRAVGGRFSDGLPRGIQYGSGGAVHGRGVRESAGDGGGGDQPGWEGSGAGQRVRGTTVAKCEVGRYLPSRR